MAFSAILGSVLAQPGNIELAVAGPVTIPQTKFPYLAIVQSRFQTIKVVPRTTSQLDTVPPEFDVAVTETAYPLVVDVSNYLSGSETVSGLSAVLTYESTSAILSSAWLTSITNVGNIVTVIMDCSKLQLGQEYQLAVHFTASTTKKPTWLAAINVVA